MAMKKHLGCKYRQTMNLYMAILSYFGFFNPVHYSKVKKNKNKTKNKDLSNEKKLAICLPIYFLCRVGWVLLYQLIGVCNILDEALPISQLKKWACG